MKHKYNIPGLLLSVLGYKGLPYPGGFLPKRPGGDYTGGEVSERYSEEMKASGVRQELLNGTQLYKQDAFGRWYFMPVSMRHPDIEEGLIELPNAVINLEQNKKIVETDLVNRKGTVKELISIEDYSITIAAFIQSDDGSYPAGQIARIRELFQINESVELVSVLTDLLFDKDDKVVITNVSWPATPGIEDGQAVTFQCKSDMPFELIIK